MSKVFDLKRVNDDCNCFHMHEKHIWGTEYDLWSNIFIRIRQAVEICLLGKSTRAFHIGARRSNPVPTENSWHLLFHPTKSRIKLPMCYMSAEAIRIVLVYIILNCEESQLFCVLVLHFESLVIGYIFITPIFQWIMGFRQKYSMSLQHAILKN